MLAVKFQKVVELSGSVERKVASSWLIFTVLIMITFSRKSCNSKVISYIALKTQCFLPYFFK